MMNDPYLSNLMSPTLPRQEVIRVNGENGAMAIRMGANSSVLALDMNDPILWMVVSDGAGYKTTYAFDLTPHVKKPEPDMTTFEDRLDRIERLLEEVTSHNAKPGSGNPEQRSDRSKPTGQPRT